MPRTEELNVNKGSEFVMSNFSKQCFWLSCQVDL